MALGEENQTISQPLSLFALLNITRFAHHHSLCSSQEAFNKAKEENFVLDDGKAYGAGKSAKVGKGGGTLTFLRIFGASHMAPRDQPEATREMLNRFMQRNGEVIV
jgi:hypothetical protein